MQTKKFTTVKIWMLTRKIAKLSASRTGKSMVQFIHEAVLQYSKELLG